MRPALQNLAISLLTILTGYVGIEAYFAATWPQGLTTTNASVRFENFTPPLNGDGFRQRPFDSHLFDANAVRILFLGDSFTFGFGVADGDARFPDLLAGRLNQAATGGRRYYVYNAGVSATEPTRWIGHLRKLMPSFRPNIVFAVFFLRDGTTMCTSLVCFNQQIAEWRQKYTGGFLYDHSHVARAVEEIAVANAFNARYQTQMIDSYLGTESETAIWRREQASLLTLAAICRDNGIPFHLVLFPVLMNLDSYPFDRVEAEIARFADAHAMPVVSLTPGFLHQIAHELWVGPGDQHPNARAHRIAADTLYPYLVRSLTSVRKSTSASLSP